tara:strand:- start:125 stop:484 length:360 start_codon:yes stop_codon:yes gene_type:complete
LNLEGISKEIDEGSWFGGLVILKGFSFLGHLAKSWLFCSSRVAGPGFSWRAGKISKKKADGFAHFSSEISGLHVKRRRFMEDQRAYKSTPRFPASASRGSSGAKMKAKIGKQNAGILQE